MNCPMCGELWDCLLCEACGWREPFRCELGHNHPSQWSADACDEAERKYADKPTGASRPPQEPTR